MISNQRAFTIVELLIVIVVIAILASISIVAFNGIQQRAQSTAVKSEQVQLSRQVQLAMAQSDSYPASISDCPTPTSGNLCLQPKAGQTLSYYAFVPGAARRYNAAIHSNAQPAYELLVRNQSSFYYSSSAEINHTNEFVQYMDMAPIIDAYGLRKYSISFDIKSASVATNNMVSVYMQNGSGSRYVFGQSVPVSTNFERRTVVLTPTVSNLAETQSILAFYGTYGTGNLPTIKNVEIQLAQ